ncbi:MAG: SurA N-terminal domain-containing protein [Burkholderiales bacterium]|nr:SurA N-terminal domain-containing protein [Burkholderiales bacterium]
MFDFVHNNKRLLQIILAVILLPFAFFGIDSYFRAGDSVQGLATVGDSRISQREFNEALRERQDAIQRMLNGRADAALLDNSELRFAVLEGLIRQRLLINQALRSGMVISDQQLQSVIGELPVFQDEGRFSFQRYEQFLKSQGMTPAMFETRLRNDLILQQADDAYSDSVFIPRTVADRLLRISGQQREVSQSIVAPDRFLAQVKLEADAAKKYYDGHQDEFRIPEQARVEYVVLSADTLSSQIQVDPAEVRKYYEAHRAQYEIRETRQASHILVTIDAGASAEARQKARAKAEEIYSQLKRNPEKFAELAKQYSQDPGSAANGGDLGFFSRGSMVKPFDDTVFQMKVGDISAPVESQYGFHIIRLTAIKPGQVKSLDEVRGQIEAELRKQLAGRKFAEIAENFNNIVFEQSESLKPAAELARTAIQKSGWITREHADDARLNNPKLLQAIFSEEVLRNKRNTEAVEVAPGVLVAARVVEHKPAAVQPFAEVSAAIVKKLTLQQAGQLAIQDGRDKLEKLRQGKDVQVTWGAPQLVSRNEAKGMSEPVLRQAFKADAGRLPAYAGADNPGGGFVLLKISRVVEPEKTAADKQTALTEELRQVIGQEEMAAYIDSLKRKTTVKISKELLEKK